MLKSENNSSIVSYHVNVPNWRSLGSKGGAAFLGETTGVAMATQGLKNLEKLYLRKIKDRVSEIRDRFLYAEQTHSRPCHGRNHGAPDSR